MDDAPSSSTRASSIAEYEASIKTLDADPRIPAAEKPARSSHAEQQLAILRKR